ncbi:MULTISPECIES: OmpA family protein [unclassified Acidisoma]|jgi:outer membrane protein OmpA-like peptidoglycan-associated protein|uniref:OmpA family protein n=1 Tax=unclassified Acidisoma TaxID=2634065 RepID=UPI00131A6AEF|nr:MULTISPECIES: OmpA family protein [unclassified Acidisoma]
MLLLLSGCDRVPPPINPVSWWHGLEGGEIAANRPPPPGDKQPYPMLAAAPTRPAGMPDWEWKKLTETLAEQRSAAQGYAAANPVSTLPPATRPAAIAQVPAITTGAPLRSSDDFAALSPPPAPAAGAPAAGNAAASSAGSSASDPLAAMNFDAATPSRKTKAPRTTALPAAGAAAPASSGFFAPTNEPSIPGALSPAAQADEAMLPALPGSLPMAPSVPGFGIPQTPRVFVAAVPPPQPAPYVPPPPLPKVAPVMVGFAPGSAIITVPMDNALKALAHQRKTAHIEATGYGGAKTDAIGVQAAAMPLAIERARAITVRLLASGVKRDQIRTEARATGTGGLARLID